MHISCIHHFMIGPILTDLIGPTFCYFCQSSCTEKNDKLFFSLYSLLLAVSLNEVTGQIMERVGSAS